MAKFFAVIHPPMQAVEVNTGQWRLNVNCEAWQVDGNALTALLDPSMNGQVVQRIGRSYYLTDLDTADGLRAKFVADIQAVVPLAVVVFILDSIGTL